MSRMRAVACMGSLVCAFGCAKRVDVPQEQAKLLETDRAWAAVASTSKNADSVIGYWTDDARVVMPMEPIVSGKEALRKMVADGIATPGFSVSWTPEMAVVAEAGDLGYTRGTNRFTVPDSAGGTITMTGRYLAVWRRGADGRWRCVEDYGSPAPPAAAGT